MLVHELLTPTSTLAGLEGCSKKRTLEQVSHLLAELNPEMDESSIFNGLHGREKLGSTGVGDGIAIPHCRLSGCTDPKGFFIKLEEPIDFDAIDGKPVDLIFTLVVPEDATSEHLETLASIAELFSKDDVRSALREADNSQSLYNTIRHLSA